MFSGIEKLINNTIDKVLKDSNIDFKTWWKNDFETDIFVKNEDDLKFLSNDELSSLQSDWIYSIIDGIVTNICLELGIKIDNNSKFVEEIWEITRNKIMILIQNNYSFQIINEDGTLFGDNYPENPLKEKWAKLYPPIPKPEFSQVCDIYSCMWCDRCPNGGDWKVPKEDKEVWDKYMKDVDEYFKLHNPSLYQKRLKNKWFIEVIQDFDGSYYANLTIDGDLINDLPIHVNYNTLKKAIKNQTGIEILKRKDMIFHQYGRKKYAYIDATQNLPDCRITLSDILNGHKPKFN